MSDVLPKLKMYLLVSFIALFFQLGITLSSLKLEITNLVTGALSGFIPFVGVVNIVISDLPTDISIIFLMITSVLSGIQIFILAMIILQIVSNIIWNPDV